MTHVSVKRRRRKIIKTSPCKQVVSHPLTTVGPITKTAKEWVTTVSTSSRIMVDPPQRTTMGSDGADPWSLWGLQANVRATRAPRNNEALETREPPNHNTRRPTALPRHHNPE